MGHGGLQISGSLGSNDLREVRFQGCEHDFSWTTLPSRSSRDWPADTLNPDDSARTPLWTKEIRITRDQYEVVRDVSQRNFYGTIISLRAKEGTEFYDRMAAWPAAFEEAMKETCRRNFQEDHYSIYVHGHSTGGPFAMIAT